MLFSGVPPFSVLALPPRQPYAEQFTLSVDLLSHTTMQVAVIIKNEQVANAPAVLLDDSSIQRLI